MTDDLTHFDKAGRAHMVDVSGKGETDRRAVAKGRVRFSQASFETVHAGVKKGDITSVAELAGIMGAKQTPTLIPLCHPLPISGVSVRIEPNASENSFDVIAEVKTTGRTGVEMEALTAVSVACLTIYDMAKSVDKSMTIEEIALIEKAGGKSGDFVRGD